MAYVCLSYRPAGGPGAAASVYRRTMRCNPDWLETMVQLAHALSDQGQKKEARELWDSALKLCPELAVEA